MSQEKKFRIEKDSLGEIEVPINAYYGSFTRRAKNNFQISGIRAHEIFQKALGTIKLASTTTNIELGEINKKNAKAIKQACQEFIDGKFNDEFTLDIFQAGAGTSYNMNANEIIANRANELLKEKKGEYKSIHPNNHINRGQSTNDVIPASTKLAILFIIPNLIQSIENLEKTLIEKIKKFKNIIKVGRTHLQDAVPISFGQTFDSYLQAIIKSKKLIEEQSKALLTLGSGGTAVGTGITCNPKYKDLMIKNLSKITKKKFKSAKNLTEMANNMNDFLNLSSSLKSYAINLINLCNDLKLMNMGPKAGLSEIKLPEVQPGSSIMPGKINPSIPESIEMVCFQVLGNDKTIELSAQRSQFELNVMCPIIMYNIIQSIQILNNGTRTLDKLCIQGLEINKKKVEKTLNNSLCLATSLTPKLGYSKTAEIVKQALKNNSTIKEEVLKDKLLTKKELKEILKNTL